MISQHQYAPSPIERPDYSAKIQYIKDDISTPLTAIQTKHIERVVGKFLYYGRAINKTMLHALNNIASIKSKKTQTTWKVIQYFPNYAASNQGAKIIFQGSDVEGESHSTLKGYIEIMIQLPVTHKTRNTIMATALLTSCANRISTIVKQIQRKIHSHTISYTSYYR